jgi:hypothetical protein
MDEQAGPRRYRIVVRGRLTGLIAAGVEHLELEPGGGESTLTGRPRDQAQLHGCSTSASISSASTPSSDGPPSERNNPMTTNANLTSRARRRLPLPAMIVALGALVMSTGGTVTAAALITSRNIKDNTIRSVDIRDATIKSRDVYNGSLTGADLKNNTLTGADINESTLEKVPNADKVDGFDAANLVAGGPLPSGRTITGTYAVLYVASGPNVGGLAAFSFGASLPTAPAVTFIPKGGAAMPTCPGSAANPKAAPGQLCVYEGSGFNAKGQRVFKPSTLDGDAADRFGAGVIVAANGQGAVASTGTWAVTAP